MGDGGKNAWLISSDEESMETDNPSSQKKKNSTSYLFPTKFKYNISSPSE